LWITSGADVKTVSIGLGVPTAATTLGVYGHLWPDTYEYSRIAVERITSVRIDKPGKGQSVAGDEITRLLVDEK
jgi:hypothetical protein